MTFVAVRTEYMTYKLTTKITIEAESKEECLQLIEAGKYEGEILESTPLEDSLEYDDISLDDIHEV